jgi:hypothetical protein
MSDTHNQPAFPLLNEVSWKGMTLLDYYICHAPVEPWKHWKPQMREKPKEIWCLGTPGQRLEFATFGDLQDFCGTRTHLSGASYVDRSASDAWETEYVEQRARQWPIYWAMLMIEQRENVI